MADDNKQYNDDKTIDDEISSTNDTGDMGEKGGKADQTGGDMNTPAQNPSDVDSDDSSMSYGFGLDDEL